MITTTIERNMKKNERKYMKWKKLLDFVIFNYYYYYYCVYSHIVSGGKQEEIWIWKIAFILIYWWEVGLYCLNWKFNWAGKASTNRSCYPNFFFILILFFIKHFFFLHISSYFCGEKCVEMKRKEYKKRSFCLFIERSFDFLLCI